MSTATTPKNYRWHGVQDAEVWSAFKSGDWQAFEYIYSTYLHDLFNYGMKVKENSSLVEDAIQELFVELWKSRENLADAEKIKFYLLKSLRWKICHLLKRESKLYAQQGLEETTVVLPHENYLIQTQQLMETKQHLKHCIEKLPPRQKEVLQLLFFEDFSHAEIAAIMELRLRSVYVLSYRALSSLKKDLIGKGIRFVTLLSMLLFL